MPKLWPKVETCHHILHCEEERRVAALNCTIDLLDSWLKKVGTDHSLRQCLVQYARTRGGDSMAHVARGQGARFEKLAQSMDSIGWRRYMNDVCGNYKDSK